LRIADGGLQIDGLVNVDCGLSLADQRSPSGNPSITNPRSPIRNRV
jgi:hypothetical protein